MTTSTPLSVVSQGSGLSVRASSRSRSVTRGTMWGKVVLVSGGPSAERGTLRTPRGLVPLRPPPHLPRPHGVLARPQPREAGLPPHSRERLLGSAVAQQRPWLCDRCAWGHRLVQHQLLPARLSGCAGRGTLLSLLGLRLHFPGLRWGAGLQSPERWVLGRRGFSSFPTGCPVPSAWHAPPCEREGLAQLSCVCAQTLVLFSYEMLPWVLRQFSSQRGTVWHWLGEGQSSQIHPPPARLSPDEAGRSWQAREGELLPLPLPSFRLFRNGLSFFS